MKKYNTEKKYHMHIHIVLSTRLRLRLFKDSTCWAAFVQAAEESCKNYGGKLLHIENGVSEAGKGLRFIYSAVHIQVLLQGEVGPSELAAIIRQKAWEIMKDTTDETLSRNPFTKDFYIADHTHFSETEALSFLQNRLPGKTGI